MPADPPAILEVDADRLNEGPALATLIAAVREDADGFVILSGGAGRMSRAIQRRLVLLLGALSMLVHRGRRIAVADGGTRAGLMEAAGLARQAGGNRFPLIGIAPAPAITPTGDEARTPVDPNHSHIIAVTDRSWEASRRADGWTPKDGYWGSETRTMYRIFERLSAARPSVALVANGGAIVLDEIRENVNAARPLVLIGNSGRAADAVVSLLNGEEPLDDEVRRLRDRALAMGLPGPPALYRTFDLAGAPDDLSALLDAVLERGGSKAARGVSRA
jgi:hypothetical protein